MAMTGLQIYKMLPKTNCAKCGYSTCLAFGMALASGKTGIDKCPDVTQELTELFDTSSSTPIKEISFGTDETEVKLGGEKVLFRHEESFYNQTCIAIALENSMNETEFKTALKEINELTFNRAGAILSLDAVAMKYSKHDENFASFAQKAPANKALILICENPAQMELALEKTSSRKPLIYCKNATNTQLSQWAGKYSLPIISGDTSAAEKESGKINIVINNSGELGQIIENSIHVRRNAIKQKKNGLPMISFLEEEKDQDLQILFAAAMINRYINAVVISTRDRDKLLTLLTLRHNIYTDPRKPIQVEPGIYPIGSPSADAPVMITTNFSLTQFLVAGEIESSRVPCWLLVIDTDGTSLLTAWAADKFNGERIAKAMQKYGLENTVSHKTAIISAYVSGIKDELEAASGWKITVGPADSSGISPWLKRNYRANA